ncbi:chondroitin sulfate synthase 2 isoform X2 [Prorops nasuta]|uniref:chondroitin sulfate synthase 2 isoform X2 n=1 Tax=Prorops nasuta TaxID=863751 RepID=UPI0034CD5BED
MGSLMKFMFSHFWGNMYLVIGICMGLSLSLLFAPVDVIEYQETEESISFSLNRQYDIDEYEPRINNDNKPRIAQKVPKAFIRPRYYSTELGIREKLFVGVLTSSEYLHKGTKPNVSLPGIVGFTDTRSILKPFHAMKYIIDNYLEDFDYYLLIKDMTYINARRLINFVSKISVSQDIHVGAFSEFPQYCSLESGVLLSNSVVKGMKNNLDWCVKNTYSDSDDVNFGRCIMYSTSVACSNKVQGQTYHVIKLAPTFNFEEDLKELIKKNALKDSLTIYTIYDHLTMYKLHSYFTAVEAMAVQEKIFKLRSSMIEGAKLSALNYQNTSWPIGNQAGSKPMGRFDVLRWTYFNETHMFLETDFINLKEMQGDKKSDINYIMDVAINNIQYKYKNMLQFKKLINGYQRFDVSRGVDYILDLSFIEKSTNREIKKRVEICKPLGKVEILPVPYVTENTRINMILVIEPSRKQDALDFMENYANSCMQNKYKTFLMVVLLYSPDSPSKGKEDLYYEIKQFALSLTENYKKDLSKVTWLSIRLPTPITSIELEPMLQIAVADLVVRKFSSDSLILFVETRMNIKLDYLNRVRMNTISQYQVFSPIPFVEFHPDIAYMNEASRVEVDINRNYGQYDQFNYNNVAFYTKDYTAMRKTVEANIPLIRSDKDILQLLKYSKHNAITSLFEMFVSFSDLHSFRAVEPALKIRYKELNCGHFADKISQTCAKQKSTHLGQRGQLAKLILDYNQSY